MHVILDKPMRYLRTDTDFWQIVDPASDYVARSSSSARQKRKGEFAENLISYTHVTLPEINLDDAIHAFVGGGEDVGIIYDWNTHANVAEALRTVDKYSDFYDILEQLGYNQSHAVTVTATEQLQEKVDQARE